MRKKQKFLPYQAAVVWVRSRRIRTRAEFHAMKDSRPKGIPSNPDRIYKGKGWVSYGEFLGTGRVRRMNHLLPFEAARELATELAKKLNISTQKQYSTAKSQGKLPVCLPYLPDQAYAGKGFTNIYDFLGVTPRFRKVCVPIDEAIAEVRRLGIKSMREYRARYGEMGKNMPANPESTYRGSGTWVSMYHFFGVDEPREVLDFKSARALMRGVGLKSIHAFWETSKNGGLPAGVPSNPPRRYKNKGWKGFPDFLGYEHRYQKQS